MRLRNLSTIPEVSSMMQQTSVVAARKTACVLRSFLSVKTLATGGVSTVLLHRWQEKPRGRLDLL